MTTLTSRLLLLVAAAALLPGCRVLMDTALTKPSIQAPPLKVTQKVKPVLPDEITPANAKAKAHELLEEIEQDAGK
jgi:hypothetical protein